MVVDIVIVICVFLAAAFISMAATGKPKSMKPRLLEPHEVEWGSGKDLSVLFPIPDDINTPVSELEQWWETTQSKDARIKELEDRLDSVNREVIKQHSIIRNLRFGMDRPGDRELIPTPTLSDPSKVTILPKIVSYDHSRPSRVGVTFEGDSADEIMEPGNTTYVTIRDSKVIGWHLEHSVWD